MNSNEYGAIENAEINLLNVTAIRRTIYNFISRGFSHEIDQTYLDQARNYLPMLKNLEVSMDNSDYVNGLTRLEEFIGKIKDDNELVQEYACKFVTVLLNLSGDGSLGVDPYESIYLSTAKALMQESRDQVVEFYAEYGHGVGESFKEPEDHIAAELSFLASLNGEILKDIDSGKEFAEIERKLKGQLEFMKKHLMLWLPLLSLDLKRVDPEGFYGILGELAHGFCRTDVLFLEDLLEYFKK